MEPKSPSKTKIQSSGFFCNPRFTRFVTVSILIVLLFLGIFGGYLFFKHHSLMSKTVKMNTYFTVVLDCGSTGSRVNVFEWMVGNGSKIYGNLPVLLHSYPDNMNKSNGCEYHCMQTQPGLHNFVNDAVGMRASLEPLIRYAEKLVPLDRQARTPVFVLATAGMRRLMPQEAAQILEGIRNIARESEFLYRNNRIRVLSGKEEAYYGWVALNYKMGVFGSSSRLSTLGLLDLGGSSLQVVAEVDISMEDEHAFRSRIGPVEHNLVAYSLPAFGLNEAFDRTIVMLSHTQAMRESLDGMLEVRHPCLGSNVVKNYTCHGCVDRFSRNVSNKNELNSVFLVGDPNWEQCEVIAREAAVNSSSLDSLQQLTRSECIGLFSYGGNTKLAKILHTVSRYHALSGFFAVYHALNLSTKANLTRMWELGEERCSRSITNQRNMSGHDCFRVPYLTSLIQNALCLSDVEIIFGPGDVSWTLGASLIEGDFLWHDAEKLQENRVSTLKDLSVMRPSTLLTFVFLSFVLVIVYCCQIKLPMLGRKSSGTRTSLPSYLHS